MNLPSIINQDEARRIVVGRHQVEVDNPLGPRSVIGDWVQKQAGRTLLDEQGRHLEHRAIASRIFFGYGLVTQCSDSTHPLTFPTSSSSRSRHLSRASDIAVPPPIMPVTSQHCNPGFPKVKAIDRRIAPTSCRRKEPARTLNTGNVWDERNSSRPEADLNRELGLTMNPRHVGILVFPEVEVLDFCGPFEVFSVTRLDEERRRLDKSPYEVVIIAEIPGVVVATGGLKIVPDHRLEDCPPLDVLVVPGGWEPAER